MELAFNFDKKAMENVKFLQKHYKDSVPDLMNMSLALLRIAAI